MIYKIVLQGTKSFNNYGAFCRAMIVALSDMSEHDSLVLYAAGSAVLNNHAIEFTNKTKKSLKGRNIKLTLIRSMPQMFEDKTGFDKFFFFCNNGEGLSPLAKEFRSSGIDVLPFYGN